jgi:hypothetical protein
MKAMLFDDAPAVYWFKDVLLAFAKYLALEAAKQHCFHITSFLVLIRCIVKINPCIVP